MKNGNAAEFASLIHKTAESVTDWIYQAADKKAGSAKAVAESGLITFSIAIGSLMDDPDYTAEEKVEGFRLYGDVSLQAAHAMIELTSERTPRD
ncbi:hypothetical protein KUW19_00735 [Ferrimonas balearica]|uniref:hypothetical protein n=1 Tax=Ferrimonas balearica TaxID=44012 RepID=UPI001C962603|nr:hypothetical protein [Ferrimonas balearica]MBY6105002.1 hypothetical protein [Ferrimonas balearica]